MPGSAWRRRSKGRGSSGRPSTRTRTSTGDVPRAPTRARPGSRPSRLARAKGFPLRTLSAQQTFEAAQKFFRAGRAADALDLLDAIPVKALKGPLAQQERLLRVQILYALRENGKAVAEADGLVRDTGSNKASLLALLKAAWALIRTGDHEGILSRGGLILERAGTEEALRAEALHCMGTSAYVHGRFAEAAKYLSQMEGLKGAPSTLASGLYKRAWCLYMTGDTAGARSFFRRLLNQHAGPEIEKPSAYWEARLAVQAGDREARTKGALGPRYGHPRLLGVARPGAAGADG